MVNKRVEVDIMYDNTDLLAQDKKCVAGEEAESISVSNVVANHGSGFSGHTVLKGHLYIT